jgi:5-methylthioadenosine/S-adenosylhomocysteine deaminase
MTTEDIYKFALLGMVENLENGVTTINDMYFHTQYLIDAAKVAGIDQVTTVTLMDVDGDARGQERIENFRKCFAENPNANFSLGIHGFYTTTPAYIEKCVALAKELNINLVHIHFCENDAEVKEILSRHSAKTPAEILERYFKDFKIVLAHGVILSIDDMERIGKLSASISHNPISNLRLGCGVTDVVNLQKYNVNVGLGTDGDGSGSNQSVLKNARLACLLQKGTYKDPTLIKAENAFEMATINGAKALGLEKSKGTIEVGKDADLNIIDLKTSTTFPVNDIISDIIYNCEAQNIETVIVKGKIVIKDGKHTSIDKQKLFDECQALLERIKKSN